MRGIIDKKGKARTSFKGIVGFRKARIFGYVWFMKGEGDIGLGLITTALDTASAFYLIISRLL